MATLGADTTGKDVVARYGENARGKTFVVTGPSKGGLGDELLVTLAAAGPAQLILAGRDESKIAPVIERIKETNPSIETVFVHLDLLDNGSVREAAEAIKSKVDHIDVLVLNAGVAARKNYELSKDGVETHFAANYLGHFLLTNLIIDKVAKVQGIVISVSSMAYGLAEANVVDPNFNGGKEYHAWVAYGRSKTANVLFSHALAEKYGNKIVALTVDPGMAHGTNLLANSGVDEAFLGEGVKLFEARTQGQTMPEIILVSNQQAVASMLLAALDPSLRGKGPVFIKECAITEVLPYASDKGEALKLWALSEKLVGEKFAE